MDEVYHRLLLNVPKAYAAKAHNAFQWMAFSKRSLYLEEVAEAAILDSQGHLNTEQRFSNPYDIVDICSSVVTLSASAEDKAGPKQMSFVHADFKEYLISNAIKTSRAKAFSVSETDAQILIGNACLSYLISSTQADKRLISLPLLDYVVKHWYKHLEAFSGEMPMPESTASLAIALLDIKNNENTMEAGENRSSDTLEGPEAMHPDASGCPPPLYYASLMGMKEVVSKLLARGNHHEQVGGFCGTPLQAAALGGHLSISHYLLQCGADPNASSGYYGSPLQAAAYRGHLAIARLLLDCGAEVDHTSGYYGSALQAAAIGGHVGHVQLLIEYGADVNAKGGVYGNALIAAAHGGHQPVVIMLLENGAEANEQEESEGFTALYAAATLGYSEVVSLLLERGADPNAQGGRYGTALNAAAHENYCEIAEQLVRKGAELNPRNASGSRAEESALHMAIQRGHEAMAELLLRQRSVDANLEDEDGLSPLMKAANRGNVKIVQLLLEKGVNTRAADTSGATSLMMAADAGHEAVMGLLQLHGAEVDATDRFGQTALMMAAAEGHEAVVRLLLRCGAEVEVRNESGQTALEIAKAKGDDSIARLLESENLGSATDELEALETKFGPVAEEEMAHKLSLIHQKQAEHAIELERTMKVMSDVLHMHESPSLYGNSKNVEHLLELLQKQIRSPILGQSWQGHLDRLSQHGGGREMRLTGSSLAKIRERPSMLQRSSSPMPYSRGETLAECEELNLFLNRRSTS